MPAPLRGGLVMHVQNAQIHYGGIEQQHTDIELEQTQPAACLAHTQGHNHCIFYCSSQSSANAHHAVAFLARRGYELELSLTHTHTAYELELSLTHTHTQPTSSGFASQSLLWFESVQGAHLCEARLPCR